MKRKAPREEVGEEEEVMMELNPQEIRSCDSEGL